MKSMMFFAVLVIVLSSPVVSMGGWNANPNNWENSASNWENSSGNWENSPGNWENNPYNSTSDRIVYDNDGRPSGYVVPKDSGGANIYDFNGNRRGYVPADN